MIKQRWFRYSLRGMLLLIAVAAVWLAWEVNRVRARRQFVAQFGSRYSFVSAAQWQAGEAMRIADRRDNSPPNEISRFRELLGDSAIQHYTLPMGWSNEEAERVGALFPEAAVGAVGPATMP
jgi:hypothetical protein